MPGCPGHGRCSRGCCPDRRCAEGQRWRRLSCRVHAYNDTDRLIYRISHRKTTRPFEDLDTSINGCSLAELPGYLLERCFKSRLKRSIKHNGTWKPLPFEREHETARSGKADTCQAKLGKYGAPTLKAGPVAPLPQVARSTLTQLATARDSKARATILPVFAYPSTLLPMLSSTLRFTTSSNSHLSFIPITTHIAQRGSRPRTTRRAPCSLSCRLCFVQMRALFDFQ